MRGPVLVAVLALACAEGTKTSCQPPAKKMELFATALYQPEYADGRMLGLRVASIKPGSFLACLGLRDGDRMVEFDGEPIDDPKFFERFGTQKAFTLVVTDAAGVRRRIVND